MCHQFSYYWYTLTIGSIGVTSSIVTDYIVTIGSTNVIGSVTTLTLGLRLNVKCKGP
jgi:hypothetical protein